MVTSVAGVQGHCESGFGRVADVFAAQLKSGRDIGGSVGVYRDGKPVVTIWGGSADPGCGVPWTEHTITPIGSTGKALASTALLILVDRGLIDLDEPVASYWPAFGQNGKAEIPVRLVLSHRSGVAALTSRSARSALTIMKSLYGTRWRTRPRALSATGPRWRGCSPP
jgi:CubicO group peptidase (beta-lactamase class C family)